MKNKYCDKALKQSHVATYPLRWHDYDNTVCYTRNAMVVLKVPLFDYPKNTVLNVRLIRCTDLSGRTPSWGAYIVVVGPSGCTHAFKRRQFRRRIRIITKGRWRREGS